MDFFSFFTNLDKPRIILVVPTTPGAVLKISNQVERKDPGPGIGTFPSIIYSYEVTPESPVQLGTEVEFKVISLRLA